MAKTLRDFCGWRHDKSEAAYARLRRQFLPFQLFGDVRTTPGTPIWEYARRVLGGRLPFTWEQQTGDCVSMGAAQAGQYLQLYEIGRKRQEETFRPWFPPYIYATSRVDVGGGELGRDPGSTGAWAATAMMHHGILFSDDPGVPSYSGTLADEWGYRGAPAEHKAEARDNPVKSASKITTVDQIRSALMNYKPVTYAIMWPYDTEPHEKDGLPVLERKSNVGGHQVCLLHWIDDPFPAAFLLNSWGERVHTGPAPNGEPPGGAYIRVADIERDMGGMSEFFALSQFVGHKCKPDYGFV